MWALRSVASIAKFPVLGGIDALMEETGDNGASSRAVEECAKRWHDKGREVIIVTPQLCVGDVNDVLIKWSKSSHG